MKTISLGQGSEQNSIEKSQHRMVFPDVCKFVAIFLVTCSHCAQTISGQVWTNFLYGSEIDIAFNMPLFMIISGWFISPQKLRNAQPKAFIWQKFQRLMLPCLTWYLLFCIFTLSFKGKFISFYWYLSALFLCHCLLLLFARFIRNDALCMFISTLVVVCCPGSHFLKINFMFPFLWTGYLLHRYFEKRNATGILLLCTVISFLLIPDWSQDYSVYLAPFKILSVNGHMLYAFCYRFGIGFALSTVIIVAIKQISSTGVAKTIGKYGQYSLVIYTASFVVNGVLSKLFNSFHLHTNQLFVIDLVSVIACLTIVVISVVVAKAARRNRYTRLLLLGEGAV